MKEKSIRTYLKLWLAICCCILAVTATGLISLFSYVAGKDTQDEVLTHISNVINTTNLNNYATQNETPTGCKHDDDFLAEVNELWLNVKELLTNQEDPGLVKTLCENLEDTRILIEVISEASSPVLRLSTGVKDGFYNVKTSEDRWRVLVITKADDQFAVAQSIEVRNKLIFDNTLLSVLTVLMFTVMLLFFINWAVSYFLKPIQELSDILDNQNPKVLESIKVSKKIKELSPFVDAVNRLIERINFQSQAEKRFISDASHELRTPISAIYLQFENLELAHSEEERLDRIAQLKVGIVRVKHLLEQLLKLSKVQSVGVEGNQTQPLNLQVQEAVALLYPLAEQKSIDLGIPNDISSYTQPVNSSALQVSSNAISNAIAHTPNNGTIDVTIDGNDQSIRILVEDSGPGIPDADKTKVTQAFFSGENSKNSGAGLGLTISNEISTRLGGHISFEDSKLGGLKFVFSLPKNS